MKLINTGVQDANGFEAAFFSGKEVADPDNQDDFMNMLSDNGRDSYINNFQISHERYDAGVILNDYIDGMVQYDTTSMMNGEYVEVSGSIGSMYNHNSTYVINNYGDLYEPNIAMKQWVITHPYIKELMLDGTNVYDIEEITDVNISSDSFLYRRAMNGIGQVKWRDKNGKMLRLGSTLNKKPEYAKLSKSSIVFNNYYEDTSTFKGLTPEDQRNIYKTYAYIDELKDRGMELFDNDDDYIDY